MAMHTVCKTDDLPAGKMKAFSVGDEKIVLYHFGEVGDRPAMPVSPGPV